MQKAIVHLGWDLDKEFPRVFGEYRVLNCVSCEEAHFPEHVVHLYVFTIIAPYAFGEEYRDKTVFHFLQELRDSNSEAEYWLYTSQPVSLDDWLLSRGVTSIVHPDNLVSELKTWAAKS